MNRSDFPFRLGRERERERIHSEHNKRQRKKGIKIKKVVERTGTEREGIGTQARASTDGGRGKKHPCAFYEIFHRIFRSFAATVLCVYLRQQQSGRKGSRIECTCCRLVATYTSAVYNAKHSCKVVQNDNLVFSSFLFFFTLPDLVDFRVDRNKKMLLLYYVM